MSEGKRFRELQAILKEYEYHPVVRSIAYIASVFVFYLVALGILLLVDNLWLKFFVSFIAGVLAGKCFLIGHDACHGSYTHQPVLDRIIGTIAFLPSLHSYSLWEYGHNRLHHTYTNLKGQDFVWVPLSVSDYEKLSILGRLMYRIYRSTPGFGIYYILQLWWPRLVIPRRRYIDSHQTDYFADTALVILFFSSLVICAVVMSNGFIDTFINLILVLVIPFMIVSWMIGFVVYFNHTHPQVKWFENKQDWSFYASQTVGTVCLKFPLWMRNFMGDVMNHTAHHVSTNVPLARLQAAQSTLNTALGTTSVIVDWSIKAHREIVSRCKLYDYKNQRWVVFSEIS